MVQHEIGVLIPLPEVLLQRTRGGTSLVQYWTSNHERMSDLWNLSLDTHLTVPVATSDNFDSID